MSGPIPGPHGVDPEKLSQPPEEATPADALGLAGRLRMLADTMEEGCKRSIAIMPAAELTSTMKMVEDFRSAADQLDAFEGLIKDCIGAEPVREEAENLLILFEKANDTPTGPGLDWITEAAGGLTPGESGPAE